MSTPLLANVDEAPPVAIWERHGAWAVGLRQALGRRGLAVHLGEIRSAADCWNRMIASPASLMIIEITPETLSGACELVYRAPEARFAAVTTRRDSALATLLKELGALAVVTSPRRLTPLVDTIERLVDSLPAPDLTPRERVWRRLPWPEAAGSFPIER